MRVLFRKYKYLPKRGQVIAVLIDSKIVGDNPDMRKACSQNGQKIEVDMYTVRFETEPVLPDDYRSLLDKLTYENIMIVESLSAIRHEKYRRMKHG